MYVASHEETMLADGAAAFLRERAPVAALRALRDARDTTGFDRALWREMAGLGWAGMLVSADHGGMEFGHAGAGLVAEQMGRNLTASPFLSTAVMAAGALSAAPDAVQARWLPAIAAGEAVIAVAVDEGQRHRPDSLAIKVEHARLAGTKTAVIDGHVADAFVVAAPGLLLLAGRDAPGVTIERLDMVDSRNLAHVTFAQTPATVIAEGRTAETTLARLLDAGRAALAAELLGIAGEAFARTLDYLKQRRQFGRPIGSFQALQHRAAQVHCTIELARSLVLAAARALDDDAGDAGLLVAAAKAKAGEAAILATDEAVQMHGGIGMTDQLDIGLFLKRARVAAMLLGDGDFLADRVATLRGL